MQSQEHIEDLQAGDRAVRKLAPISASIDSCKEADAPLEDRNLRQFPPAQDDMDHATAQCPIMKTSASFTGLPAEIRLMIYDYLFERSGTILITKFSRFPPRVVQRSFDDEPAHWRKRLMWRDLEEKWMGQEPSTAVLAQVSKQIAAEVVPLIYKGKTFEFEHSEDLDTFLKCVGAAIEHVQAIQLQGPLDTIKLETWTRLRGAVGLRSLRIDHLYVKKLYDQLGDSRIVTLAYLVKHFSYFLHAHCKAQQGRASGGIDTHSVVELISIEPCEMPGRDGMHCLFAVRCASSANTGGSADCASRSGLRSKWLMRRKRLQGWCRASWRMDQ